MIQIAGVLLKLPDGRVVLNRRGKTAPSSPGLLALYGGHIDDGELPQDAASRELGEETSIKFDDHDINFISEFVVKKEGQTKKFYVFRLEIENENFKVYEGEGSEVHTIAEALARNDLSASCRKTLEIEVKRDGTKHN